MSAEKTTNSERWTLELRDQDIQPCGSEESLRNAVERLGPFKQRLNVDAERFGPWGGVGDRIPLSEEYAIEQVWQLTVGYNKQAQLERRAPRSKHVVDALSTLEQLAGQLAHHITSLDDISRHLLKTAGTGLGRFLEDWTCPLIEAAVHFGWNGFGVIDRHFLLPSFELRTRLCRRTGSARRLNRVKAPAFYWRRRERR
jgi:hypothetical protein